VLFLANVYHTPQHAATRCNTLQHTATHCNTLQQVLVLALFLTNVFLAIIVNQLQLLKQPVTQQMTSWALGHWLHRGPGGMAHSFNTWSLSLYLPLSLFLAPFPPLSLSRSLSIFLSLSLSPSPFFPPSFSSSFLFSPSPTLPSLSFLFSWSLASPRLKRHGT